ncbi:MAG: methyltransferase type 11, partial [Methylovulum sp.]|nr:methyltransferase type 11 [Methylovulum sp.]
ALVESNGFHVVKIEQITRIPLTALSKKLGLKGTLAAFVDGLSRFFLPQVANVMNAFGLGIYINLYAVKI